MSNNEEKEKKPIYKKWWFWVLIIIIIAAIATSQGGNTTTTGTGSSTEMKQTQEKFSLIDSEESHDGFAYYITGSIKNNTDKQYSYVQVTFNLYDADGAQIGTALANINNLEQNIEILDVYLYSILLEIPNLLFSFSFLLLKILYKWLFFWALEFHKRQIYFAYI